MITRFEHFSEKKALEVLVWIASNWKEAKGRHVTQFYVAKIFYFADRYHLNNSGRPVSGDKYVAMEYGPVPSFVYDLIKNNRIYGEINKDFNKSIEFIPSKKSNNIKVKALRKPDRDYFSGSDLYFLEKSLTFCKDKKVKELSDLTHEHPAWKNAWEKRGERKNYPIDYEDMVEEDNPLEDEILHALCDNARSLLFAT